MLKICVQSGNWYKENAPEDSLKFIHECRFDGIDYNIDNFLRPRKMLEGEVYPFYDQSIEDILEYYRPMKEALLRNQVEVCQTHAPFPLYFEGREDINDYLIMVVDKTCAVCQYLGCPTLVVHPFTCPDKEKEKEINLQMYRKMIPSAKKYGVKLCLENMFTNYKGHIIEGACADVSEACWYIDLLNAEAGAVIFGFCLDVGHANLMGRNIREYIKGLGRRLTILHIHENMGNKDSHLIPYTQDNPGGVDWDGFVEGLRDIGYTGTLSFETYHGVDLLPEDVQQDGLKLISAIGRSFRKKLAGQENRSRG